MVVDVKKLLAGRQAVEYYQEHQGKADTVEQERLVQEFISKLQKLGFESIDAFFEFNEYACYFERVRCFIPKSSCDGCKGRERACYPSCVEQYQPVFNSQTKAFDALSWHASFRKKALDGELNIDQMQKAFSFYFLWRQFPENAPPTCSIKFQKVAEPAFDIFWGMPLGLDPQKYERDKKKWQH